MSSYRECIVFLGLSVDSQGEAGVWYLALSMLDDLETANPTANTYANPLKETLFRLSAYSETHGFQALAHLIGARVHASVAPWQAV